MLPTMGATPEVQKSATVLEVFSLASSPVCLLVPPGQCHIGNFPCPQLTVDKLEPPVGEEGWEDGLYLKQYSEGEESHLDGNMELVNLACLPASGARWILFINILSDLELQAGCK